jgi:hypothetical protein
MQGCFNGNALDWDQQFWSDIQDPLYARNFIGKPIQRDRVFENPSAICEYPFYAR